MKLCYRGVEYDYTPPVLEVSESEVLGQYRGTSQHFSYVKHIPFPQAEADLSYRGRAYHVNRQGHAEAPAVVANRPQESKFRPVFDSVATARRTLLQESAQMHQDNIRRNLERRMAVAQSKGDAELVRQLEDEMHQLV